MKAFRNAQDDGTTENSTETWLYGTLGADSAYAYWTGVGGSRKVILRKVAETSYTPLEGAQFKIHRASPGGTLVESKGIDGEKKTLFTSAANGVYFIDEMSYGTYYIEETTTPSGYATLDGTNWFTLSVDETGISVVRLTQKPAGR